MIPNAHNSLSPVCDTEQQSKAGQFSGTEARVHWCTKHNSVPDIIMAYGLNAGNIEHFLQAAVGTGWPLSDCTGMNACMNEFMHDKMNEWMDG